MGFLPSKKSRWYLVASFLLAVFIGIGLFLMKEAEVISYASDDPKACVNCHVMISEYNSWMHSSHRERASCNDCHVPHNNVINKYFFKAKDGLLHASVFTTRREPEVIAMRPESQRVVQTNCIRCHVQQVTQIKYADLLESHRRDRTERQCWSCHREVAHGRVHGISSIKYNIAPVPSSVDANKVPQWLKEQVVTKKDN